MSNRAEVSAIDMLTRQHEEVAALFDALEEAPTIVRKQKLFEALADALVVHAAIEERHFYPAVRARRTEDILVEALGEHLGVKRAIAVLLATPIGDATFDAQLSVLRELVEDHVDEEETDLFPTVEKILDEATLAAIAREMSATQDAIVRLGDPRLAVPVEMRPPTLVSLR